MKRSIGIRGEQRTTLFVLTLLIAALVAVAPALVYAADINIAVYIGANGTVNDHAEDYTEVVSSDEDHELVIKAKEGYLIESVLINDEPAEEGEESEDEAGSGKITGVQSATIKLEKPGGDVDIVVTFRAKGADAVPDSGDDGNETSGSKDSDKEEGGSSNESNSIEKTDAGETGTGTNEEGETGTGTNGAGETGSAKNDEDGDTGTDTGNGAAETGSAKNDEDGDTGTNTGNSAADPADDATAGAEPEDNDGSTAQDDGVRSPENVSADATLADVAEEEAAGDSATEAEAAGDSTTGSEAVNENGAAGESDTVVSNSSHGSGSYSSSSAGGSSPSTGDKSNIFLVAIASIIALMLMIYTIPGGRWQRK